MIFISCKKYIYKEMRFLMFRRKSQFLGIFNYSFILRKYKSETVAFGDIVKEIKKVEHPEYVPVDYCKLVIIIVSALEIYRGFFYRP